MTKGMKGSFFESVVLHPALPPEEGNPAGAALDQITWPWVFLWNFKESPRGLICGRPVHASCFHSLKMLTTKRMCSGFRQAQFGVPAQFLPAVWSEARRPISSLVIWGWEYLPPRLVGKTKWGIILKEFNTLPGSQSTYSTFISIILILPFWERILRSKVYFQKPLNSWDCSIFLWL